MTLNRHAYLFNNSVGTITKALTDGKLNVTISGNKANTCYDTITGKVNNINIPMAQEGMTRDLIDSMQGYVDHEAAHYLLTDINKLNKFIESKENQKVCLTIMNAIEDVRVEELMPSKFAGSSYFIKKTQELVADKLSQMNDAGALVSETLDLDLMYAGVRATANQEAFVEVFEKVKNKTPLLVDTLNKISDKIKNLQTTEDTIEATEFIYEIYKDMIVEEEEQQQSKGGKAEKGDKSGSSDQYQEAFNDVMQETSKELSQDNRYLVYSTEYDKIGCTEDLDKEISLTKIEQDTTKYSIVMQKNLERLLSSKAKKFWVGNKDKGKLKGSSLYKICNDNFKVFQQKIEVVYKDTAISLVIDCSGSMAHCNKIRVAATSAYIFANILHKIKVPFEILGFTTTGFDSPVSLGAKEETLFDRITPIYIPIFKSFNEIWNPKTKKRLAVASESMMKMNGNVDGEAVAIAANRLLGSPCKRKIMIVFSDGMPSGGTFEDEKVLNTHLKSTVSSMEKQGIEVIGIGINSDRVSLFYNNNAIVNTVEDLPKILLGQLKKILI